VHVDVFGEGGENPCQCDLGTGEPGDMIDEDDPLRLQRVTSRLVEIRPNGLLN
jgi:hypothetical protein